MQGGFAADLDGGDGGGVQFGPVLDGLGSEEGYELLKGQLHIMPLPSFGVKAPANRQDICCQECKSVLRSQSFAPPPPPPPSTSPPHPSFEKRLFTTGHRSGAQKLENISHSNLSRR